MPTQYGLKSSGGVGAASATPGANNSLKPIGLNMMDLPGATYDAPGQGIPNGGLRIGIGPGASVEARNFPHYNVQPGNYKRRNGKVSLVLDDSNGTAVWLPTHVFRLCAQDTPGVEGEFYVDTMTRNAANNGWNMTYTDIDPISGLPRPDSDGDGSVMQLIDMQAYSGIGCWMQHLNRALGGKATFYVAGTGSTNIFQWTKDRMMQFLADGPFDAIILPFGPMGNALINVNLGKTATKFTELVAVFEEKVAILAPYCRALVVMTPFGNRNIPPTSAAYTLGLMFQEYLYKKAVGKFKNLFVAPTGELMGNNWQNPSNNDDHDVMNNFPSSSMVYSDGTHFAYGASKSVGAAVGFVLHDILQFYAPEMGAKAQSRLIASSPEPGGTYYSNVSGGQWGKVATKAPDVGTGTQPANTTIAVTQAGGATLVHSILNNPEGGWDWNIAITDNTGSAAGATITIDFANLGAASLLSIFNDPKNQGPATRLESTIPFGFRWAVENSVTRVDMGLYATVGGTEYSIAHYLSNNGLYNFGGLANFYLGGGAVNAAGTGYSVGDVLTVSGGTQTQTAQITVLEVSGGAIVRWYISRGGTYTATPANAASVTGGTGSGATFNFTWQQNFRPMDWGASGNWTLPEAAFIPVATYTAATLRVVVKLIGNALPTKTMNLRFGAGQLFAITQR